MTNPDRIFEDFLVRLHAGECRESDLEELCEEHPEYAAAFRERWEFLHAAGLLVANDPTPDDPTSDRPTTDGPASEREAASADLIGTRLGDRYRIRRELGRGGMGVVYAAEDELLGREVAVKLVPPGMLAPSLEERLQREARNLARLDHPAIVPIHDLGSARGAMYFVMPLVKGMTLRRRLATGPMSLGEILDIGIQVARGLGYCHVQGIVHRDIKPENIMIVEEGQRVQARITDFGLSRAVVDTAITGSGCVVGTVQYLSPERLGGEPPDAASDIYSLGCVLYECLVGRAPFGGDLHALLRSISLDAPMSPRALGAVIEPELEQLLLTCLSKRPEERPSSATQLADDLARHRAALSVESLHTTAVTAEHLEPATGKAAPFVGREAELAELGERLARAMQGESQFVVIGGDAGVGKTRLLGEFERVIDARGVRQAHGRFTPEDRLLPFHGFCEAMQSFFQRTSSEPVHPDDFADLATDLIELFPQLADVAVLREGTSGATPTPFPAAAEIGDRPKVFELLARTFVRIAGDKPLALLLEDLHLASVSIEALHYLVRRLGTAPVLVVGTYVSSEVPRDHPLAKLIDQLTGDRGFANLALAPLTSTEFKTFVEAVVGATVADSGVIDELFDTTQGNPFFARELLASLVDSSRLVKNEEGEWCRSGSRELSSDEWPLSIQEAVEKRTEDLPQHARELLEMASVLGKTFEFGDLEAIAQRPDGIDEIVDDLIDRGLLVELPSSRRDTLGFRAALVREVLYSRMSRRRRRLIHRRCVARLEERHGARVDDVAAALLHHCVHGALPEKVIAYGPSAARHALESYTPDLAIEAASTILDRLRDVSIEDPETEGEMRTLIAQAHRMAGRLTEALDAAELAGAAFERTARSNRVVEAAAIAAQIAWEGRRIGKATEWVERGLDIEPTGRELEARRQLLQLAGTLANLRGEHHTAEGFFRAAETEPDREPRAFDDDARLVVAFANRINASEPALALTIEASEVFANVFETLLRTDRDGVVRPLLCERWEMLDAGRRFVLHLRSGVQFHDGAPLTAAAVKTSLERAILSSPALTRAGLSMIRGVPEPGEMPSEGVAGIIVRGPAELELQLVEPLPILPALLTTPHVGIVRRSDARSGDLVGTGPFVLERVEAERIVLKRHAETWRPRRTRVAEVEFRQGLDSGTIAAGLRSGEIDVGRDLDPDDLDAVLRHPVLRSGVVEAPKKSTLFVLFNTNGPSTSRRALRQALAAVVQPSELVWRAIGRFALPASSFIPPGILGHDPGRRELQPNRERAAELLANAELAPPVKLRAAVHPVLRQRYHELLESLLAIWRDLGVEISIATDDMASFLSAMEHGEGVDLSISRWVAQCDDPDYFTHALFHSRSGLIRHFFSSPETDVLLDRARSEVDPDRRRELYREFERHLSDASAVLPLCHEIDYRVVGPRVQTLELSGSAPFVNYDTVAKSAASTVGPSLPARRGILHVPSSGSVAGLDPASAHGMTMLEVLPAIFETLTRVVEGARVEPWLAASIDEEVRGRRWRIRLRNDVRFHDGRRLTARDVRYTFERLLRTASDTAPILTPIVGARALMRGEATDIAGLRVVSTNELVLDLAEPVAIVPFLLSHPTTAILAEGCDPSERTTAEVCVGTGPYRVVEFEPGERLELEANLDYWRPGLPRTEGLTFAFQVPPDEIAEGFRSGDFSIACDLRAEEIDRLRFDSALAPGYREAPGLSTTFMLLNCQSPHLTDLTLRRRLLRAVHVPRLIRASSPRGAIAAGGLLPPGLLGHRRAQSTDRPRRASSDPRLAGLELTAAVLPQPPGRYQRVADAVFHQLAKNGVRVRSGTDTLPEFLDRVGRDPADLIVARWWADFPDPDSFCHGLFHSESGAARRYYESASLDEAIERGRAEPDPELRRSIYREIDRQLKRDGVLLPLFHEQVYRFARPEVAGLRLRLTAPMVAYEELELRR